MSIKYQNYFELFQLDMQYTINKKILHKHYLILSQKYHPDKNQNVTTHDIMGEIILGYNTLQNDVQRAEYILKLKNIDITQYNNPSMLLEIFELNEQLDSLSQQKDMQIFYENILIQYQKALLDFEQNYLCNREKTIIAFQYVKYYNAICTDAKNRLRDFK